MIKHVGTLVVPVVAVALSLTSASNANTPLSGAVRSFSSGLYQTTWVMEVRSDHTITFPPPIDAHIVFQGISLKGDTGLVRYRTTWEPEQIEKTRHLIVTERHYFNMPPNSGQNFDGKPNGIISVRWGLQQEYNAYAFWCQGTVKKYLIPGLVQITVDGLTGPGTANPPPVPINLEVRCVQALPVAATGLIPPPTAGSKPAPAPTPTPTPAPKAPAPAPKK